jgi:autotransporter adhesin
MTNVAPGVNGTDAVNLNQLNGAVGGVQKQINDTARSAYSGIAAATALALLPSSRPGDRLTMGIGAATYHGYQAVAIGASAMVTSRLEVRTGVGFSSNGATAGVAAGYHW